MYNININSNKNKGKKRNTIPIQPDQQLRLSGPNAQDFIHPFSLFPPNDAPLIQSGQFISKNASELAQMLKSNEFLDSINLLGQLWQLTPVLIDSSHPSFSTVFSLLVNQKEHATPSSNTPSISEKYNTIMQKHFINKLHLYPFVPLVHFGSSRILAPPPSLFSRTQSDLPDYSKFMKQCVESTKQVTCIFPSPLDNNTPHLFTYPTRFTRLLIAPCTIQSTTTTTNPFENTPSDIKPPPPPLPIFLYSEKSNSSTINTKLLYSFLSFYFKSSFESIKNEPDSSPPTIKTILPNSIQFSNNSSISMVSDSIHSSPTHHSSYLTDPEDSLIPSLVQLRSMLLEYLFFSYSLSKTNTIRILLKWASVYYSTSTNYPLNIHTLNNPYSSDLIDSTVNDIHTLLGSNPTKIEDNRNIKSENMNRSTTRNGSHFQMSPNVMNDTNNGNNTDMIGDANQNQHRNNAPTSRNTPMDNSHSGNNNKTQNSKSVSDLLNIFKNKTKNVYQGTLSTKNKYLFDFVDLLFPLVQHFHTPAPSFLNSYSLLIDRKPTVASLGLSQHFMLQAINKFFSVYDSITTVFINMKKLLSKSGIGLSFNTHPNHPPCENINLAASRNSTFLDRLLFSKFQLTLTTSLPGYLLVDSNRLFYNPYPCSTRLTVTLVRDEILIQRPSDSWFLPLQLIDADLCYISSSIQDSFNTYPASISSFASPKLSTKTTKTDISSLFYTIGFWITTHIQRFIIYTATSIGYTVAIPEATIAPLSIYVNNDIRSLPVLKPLEFSKANVVIYANTFTLYVYITIWESSLTITLQPQQFQKSDILLSPVTFRNDPKWISHLFSLLKYDMIN